MTRNEWGTLVDIVRHAWPGGWPEEAAESYFFVLKGVPVEAVLRALDTVTQRGDRFRPSAPELLTLARGGETAAIATPEEAWSLIEQAVRRIRGGIGDPEFPERHQAAVDWIAGQDRVVAAYAARRGLRGPGSLGAETVQDPVYGGATLKRVQAEYRDWTRQVEARVERGLPAVTDEMLLARGGGPAVSGGMGALLEHLRPADQLNAGEEQDA